MGQHHAEHRPLEEVLSQVGEPIGTSDWLLVDLARLRLFAASTYLTEETADLSISKNNQLGPELVDGFWMLSMLMYFSLDLFPFRDQETWGLNYGLDRVRFTAPLFVGESIRAVMTLADASRRGAGILVKTRTVLEVSGKRPPVMIADWLCLYTNESYDRNNVG